MPHNHYTHRVTCPERIHIILYTATFPQHDMIMYADTQWLLLCNLLAFFFIPFMRALIVS